jgi:hypothetical protein
VSVLARLDACIAGVDAAYRRQNEAQIREYCGRIEQLLARILARLEEDQPSASRRTLVETADRRALGRWARRIVDRIDDAALLACDPRLEQSLSDLLSLLEEIQYDEPIPDGAPVLTANEERSCGDLV